MHRQSAPATGSASPMVPGFFRSSKPPSTSSSARAVLSVPGTPAKPVNIKETSARGPGAVQTAIAMQLGYASPQAPLSSRSPSRTRTTLAGPTAARVVCRTPSGQAQEAPPSSRVRHGGRSMSPGAAANVGSVPGGRMVRSSQVIEGPHSQSSSPTRRTRVVRNSAQSARRATATPQVPPPSAVSEGPLVDDLGLKPMRKVIEPGQAQRLGPGAEVAVGNLYLRCIDALGSGSYSIVWRAEVLGIVDGASVEMPRSREVALKDVLCRTQGELDQSTFEVQLMIELGRLGGGGPPLRLPRCFSYSIDPCMEGYCVRTVMTKLPGEQLDGWYKRTSDAAVGTPAAQEDPSKFWRHALRRSCALARQLIRQVGPTLDRLAPLAWHRDVNSHNLLVADSASGCLLEPFCELQDADMTSVCFWLIDFGLAVDSQTWVSNGKQGGKWMHTDISGDCRYWPVSSWIMHLNGAEYLQTQEKLCNQYQRRLDIHGLGITGVEFICNTVLAARTAAGLSTTCRPEGLNDCWCVLLDSWHKYHSTVEYWWAQIYSVFSVGGDFGPIHSWLLQEGAVDQVMSLMDGIREALLRCKGQAGPSADRVLHVLAELIDENSTMELAEAYHLLGSSTDEEAPVPLSPGRGGATPRDRSSVRDDSAAPRPGSSTPAPPGSVLDPASVAARRALESLTPIPAISSGSGALTGREGELRRLREAQAKLRQDLESLHEVKVRLRYAKKMHEDQRSQSIAMKAKVAIAGGTATPGIGGAADPKVVESVVAPELSPEA